MPVETEIKLRLPQGPERARALLEQHGFQATGPRQLETNQTFDLPSGRVKAERPPAAAAFDRRALDRHL